MDEVSRRTFGALLAASGGRFSDYLSADDGSTRPPQVEPGDSQVVTSRGDLEAAFADLSAGDSVHISDENAPYRTTEWLDIDVDDVTVTGPGVAELVRPAEGANVGGFRIGEHDRCRGIEIRGVGYHGTPVSGGRGAERLHGVAVRDATDVTIERNRIRETYPIKHGNGGSGISVTHRCSDVRIVDNRIHRYGDRGVQLGGDRIKVYGNQVAYGLDRTISCDIWYPRHRNHTAENVAVFGNMLGNSLEGSLVGIARNRPLRSGRGYISVFGNVGFGSHKSFCHVRGPGAVENVSVQSNVSRQTTELLRTEETKKFAGIAIDPAEGKNISLRNNELYGYSGHGIHVDSSIAGLGIQNNAISGPALAGIRVAGGSSGMIAGNRVSRTGESGIRLKDTAEVVVRGNFVDEAGTYGIITEGSDTERCTDVSANYVTANNQQSNAFVPAILVRDVGAVVRSNTVEPAGAPAIAEDDGARSNHYEGNRANGDRPWRFRSPTSTVRNHSPAVDAHRDVETGRDETVTVEFERPYAEAPRVTFGRMGGGVNDRRFVTDDDGSFVGVRLVTGRGMKPLDVFVEDA